MRDAQCRKPKWYLSVLRERGRKGLPCTQLYRQMFNKDLYLLAYGNIYSNQGAMTPGASAGNRRRHVRGQDRPDHRADAARTVPVSPRPAASISRRRTGSSALSACRHGPINSSAKWSACCLRRTTSRGFLTGRTGSGKGEGVIPRCGRYTTPGPGPHGLSRVTSPTASGLGSRDPSRDTGGENPRPAVPAAYP